MLKAGERSKPLSDNAMGAGSFCELWSTLLRGEVLHLGSDFCLQGFVSNHIQQRF